MIKIKSDNGNVEVKAGGDPATLYADACTLVVALYRSLRDECSDKDVAKMFKQTCTKGGFFEDDDKKLRKSILEELMNELLDDLDDKEDD